MHLVRSKITALHSVDIGLQSTCRAKWNALTESQLLHNGNGPSQNYWETYVKAIMEPQIAAFRPAVAAADPAGVFQNQFLDNLLGIKRT